MTSSTAAFSNTISDVVSLRNSAARRIVTTPRHEWFHSFNEQLNRLMRLPFNWNGYGAGPIDYHVANFAGNMVFSACSHDVSEPQVVPGSNGDLQVEWHSADVDIELHVRAPFEVTATRYIGDECEELDLTNDFTIVSHWLDDMEARVATRRAAA